MNEIKYIQRISGGQRFETWRLDRIAWLEAWIKNYMEEDDSEEHILHIRAGMYLHDEYTAELEQLKSLQR